MCRMISILVSRQGKVLAANGIHSHAKIAQHFNVSEDQFLKYEYHLDKRELFQDFNSKSAPFEAKKSHDDAAMAFFMDCAETPERLIRYVQNGNWDEEELLNLLTAEARQVYKKTCDEAWQVREKTREEAEQVYKKTCDKAWQVYKKACNEARLVYDKTDDKARRVRNKACDEARQVYEKTREEAWIRLFSKSENRIQIWK